MNNKKYIKPKATVINIESQSILTSSPYPDFLQTEVLEVTQEGCFSVERDYSFHISSGIIGLNSLAGSSAAYAFDYNFRHDYFINFYARYFTSNNIYISFPRFWNPTISVTPITESVNWD